jgi:hypothetical protein
MAPRSGNHGFVYAIHSLSEQTIAALDGSAALIVVCSPSAVMIQPSIRRLNG